MTRTYTADDWERGARGENLDEPALRVVPEGTAEMAGVAALAGVAGYIPGVVDDLLGHFTAYTLPVDEADLHTFTLWAAHTHLMGQTYTTPRLLLTSPLPESGKTTVLEHFDRLCFAPLSMASAGSPAMLARLLDAGMRTLMIDEADRNLRPDKPGVEDLLAILNTGYKRGGTRPVLVPGQGGTWDVREMPTFAPLVMAGIMPNLPDDTISRTITVTMLPDLDGKTEESDWEQIDGKVRELGNRLASWALTVDDVDPELPPGCVGRMREKWRPLARVAAAAGGPWPDRCAALIARDLADRDHDREEGLMTDRPEVALLRDVLTAWPEGEGFWRTDQMKDYIVSRYPDRWGPTSRIPKGLTEQRIGRYFGKAFRIRSVRQSHGDERVRGYVLDDIRSAAHRLGVTPHV